MKQVAVLLLCSVFCITMLTGCNQETKQQTSTESSRAIQDTGSEGNQESAGGEESAESLYEHSDEEPPEYEDETIQVSLKQIEFLLADGEWNTDTLSTEQVVMWYAVMISEANAADEFYMSQYLVDGKDGFYIPQEELEPAAAAFLGLDSDELRADSSLYDSLNGTYKTPYAIGPLAPVDVTAGAIEKQGDYFKMALTVSISGGEPFDRELVFTQNEDGVQYLSYTSVS